MKRVFFFSIIMVSLIACDTVPPINNNEMLDGNVIFDPSLAKPEQYLLSYKIPAPTEAQKEMPAIIVCHGYSASNFEWEELQQWAEGKPFLTSLVLLGGHGRTYQDFKASGWKDWQVPIKEEYERLANAGYKNISVMGSSVGAALCLELISSGYFNSRQAPIYFFLIDPFIVPVDKKLNFINLLAPFVSYVDTEQSKAEDKYWYHFRPTTTLKALHSLIKNVQHALKEVIRLPKNAKMVVYKSTGDPVAEASGAKLIYEGVKTSNGERIKLKMIDSDLHVFTRLRLRKNVTREDIANQMTVFNDIEKKLTRR